MMRRVLVQGRGRASRPGWGGVGRTHATPGRRRAGTGSEVRVWMWCKGCGGGELDVEIERGDEIDR